MYHIDGTSRDRYSGNARSSDSEEEVRESRDRKGIYDIYIYISILGDSFESLNFFLSMEKIFCIMEIV